MDLSILKKTILNIIPNLSSRFVKIEPFPEKTQFWRTSMVYSFQVMKIR